MHFAGLWYFIHSDVRQDIKDSDVISDLLSPAPCSFCPPPPMEYFTRKKNKTKKPWPPFTIDKVTHTYVSRQRQAYRREQVLYTIWKWLVKMFFLLLMFGWHYLRTSRQFLTDCDPMQETWLTQSDTGEYLRSLAMQCFKLLSMLSKASRWLFECLEVIQALEERE